MWEKILNPSFLVLWVSMGMSLFFVGYGAFTDNNRPLNTILALPLILLLSPIFIVSMGILSLFYPVEEWIKRVKKD